MNVLTEIPLFPLSAVLFPNSKLPLYIFEERYKILINKCLKSSEEFGIIFYSENRLSETGCTAIVTELTSKAENGEMNIIVTGIRKFTLTEYYTIPDGYLTGKVCFTEEKSYGINETLLRDCVINFNRLAELVYKGSVSLIDPEDIKWKSGNNFVSFKIAEKCGINLLERQKLLEMDNENTRLEYLMNFLEKILPEIEKAGKISDIIKSDGYLE